MGSALPGGSPKQFSKTVPTAAAERLTAQSTGNVPRANGGIVVKALSTNTAVVYVGDSSVTTSDGFPLSANESISLPVDDPSKVYCISGTSSQVLRVLYV